VNYYYDYSNGAVGGHLIQSRRSRRVGGIQGALARARTGRPVLRSVRSALACSLPNVGQSRAPLTPTIARAVWSYWPKPYTAYQHRNWLDDRSHLLSWVLSVRTAQTHFRHLSLVTDDEGAELLVNRLRLPFTDVSTCLNSLRRDQAGWWVLGKLYAYREQQRPFLHIDNDVFLWRPFSRELLRTDIVAQNPERAPVTDATFYKPKWFTDLVTAHDGWLPPEWHSYVTNRGDQAVCAGVLGGQRVDALREYAERAIVAVQSERNRSAWHAIGPTAQLAHSVLIEQYYLAAYCDSRAVAGDPVEIGYLFASQEAAASPVASEQLGYTHLMAGKHHEGLMSRLDDHVRHAYPRDYRRCVSLA
jgi:hypothetical protein